MRGGAMSGLHKVGLAIIGPRIFRFRQIHRCDENQLANKCGPVNHETPSNGEDVVSDLVRPSLPRLPSRFLHTPVTYCGSVAYGPLADLPFGIPLVSSNA